MPLFAKVSGIVVSDELHAVNYREHLDPELFIGS